MPGLLQAIAGSPQLIYQVHTRTTCISNVREKCVDCGNFVTGLHFPSTSMSSGYVLCVIAIAVFMYVIILQSSSTLGAWFSQVHSRSTFPCSL
mmetsp:Transcript_101163/g.174734  ORF Transcript_101163/g.174734 Transcript_101163/m.174734 type:complete len:93 (-) Transcript_101163:223-501(-)